MDDLTEALLARMKQWPGDIQTASDWAWSIPQTCKPTPARVKTRLNQLAEKQLIERIEHRSTSGKVTAVYYRLAP